MNDYLTCYDVRGMSISDRIKIAEEEFSKYGIFVGDTAKICCDPPTRMMLWYECIDEGALERWKNEIMKLNGTEPVITSVNLIRYGIPIAAVSNTYFYIPLDCFEKYNNCSENELLCDDIDFY